MLSVPQRYRQTDRRTTYDSNTALALRASHGKKLKLKLADRLTVLVTTVTNLEQKGLEVITEHGASINCPDVRPTRRETSSIV